MEEELEKENMREEEDKRVDEMDGKRERRVEDCEKDGDDDEVPLESDQIR